ncbi:MULTISPECIES: deoxyribose-phosphate aldolase [unclassified Oceanispirochaeta]|nr:MULTISPECIES: deoxyribose-phosphate aldolase [unclassified Oceanispirochaeta]MBF9014574.1 deoxyribose-phosphate aldolase [Oceanispirochaeta sp. M2]NPD70830.1 deoxyribose-phosphate aldolase [Oceanispirochaeta sp. M1]RDG34112.1 deoxyribose-phosphate aldolase [Oceanispirochaeta sp. M1]
MVNKMEITSKEIAQMMDLSCVQADSSLEEIHDAAETAKKYNCICVFALPAHTPVLVEALKDRPDILVGGAVGFPDGGATTASKVQEAEELRKMGVNELDMVVNIAWLKAGDYELVENDISSVIKAAGNLPVKVILECHYLSDEEIVKACQICVDCGVDFVKTGTGWAPTGATLENVKLIAETVGDQCRVKAAGGVRDRETLLAMYKLGATRFGVGVRTAKTILTGGSDSDSY